MRRSHTKGEMECSLRTGKLSAKMVLQKMVDTALKEAPVLAEFSARLEASGVRVIPNQANTGRISGISFQYDSITMKGGDLGRGYTRAAGSQPGHLPRPCRAVNNLNQLTRLAHAGNAVCADAHNGALAWSLYLNLAVTAIIFAGVAAFVAFNVQTNREGG